jgi:hypothetical protein
MINLGIESVFRDQQEENPNQRHDFCAGTQPVFTSVQLGCPKIILDVVGRSRTRVMYRIHMKSGEFHAETRAENNDASIWSCTINNWYLTFEANVGEFHCEIPMGPTQFGQRY